MFNVASYDTDLAGQFLEPIEFWIPQSYRINQQELEAVTFPANVRNRTVRLFSPYL